VPQTCQLPHMAGARGGSCEWSQEIRRAEVLSAALRSLIVSTVVCLRISTSLTPVTYSQYREASENVKRRCRLPLPAGLGKAGSG